MKLLLLSQDLMTSARVEGAARQHELSTVAVRDQQAAIAALGDADAKLLFVDLQLSALDLDALAAAAQSNDVAVIACGPHVHEAKLAAARDAGCDIVVSRGQFDRDAQAIIGRLLSD